MPDPDDTPTLDSPRQDAEEMPTVDPAELTPTAPGFSAPPDDTTHRPRSAGSGSRSSADLSVPPPADAPTIPGYHITGRLGEGGMGVVWKAVQLATNRPVALKVMSQALFGSGNARKRFEREVELAARLEHPGIARVYDSGLEHGVYFYAMQFIPGTTMDDWARQTTPSKKTLLTMMRDTCLAVQHAHQRGVIHRDLKPGNILVTTISDEDSADGQAGRERPVLVDFGLARPALDEDAAMGVSVAGQVAGTPAYMSPEQAAGNIDTLDTRSDIYSLGVILYKLLTGKLPHDTKGPFTQVLKRIQDEEVRRPRSASDTASKLVDRELETLLLKALAKEPDRRYASAAAMAQDIDNYLSGEPLTARPTTAFYVLRRKARKHYKSVAAAALLAALGAGAVGWAKYRPAKYVLDSDPVGAKILLDGKVKLGCEMTPCYVKLSPGRHEIRLSHPPDYHDEIRVVEVDWGRVRILHNASGVEQIRLAPAKRTYLFDSQPNGATVTLTDAITGNAIDTLQTPGVRQMDEGYFYATFDLPGYQDPSAKTKLTVIGSQEPIRLRRKLIPIDDTGEQ